ncbi:MAG: hypothetical protein KAQ63_00720 [Candidatus Moranbacteria bacterium]|nr:hypothetical protein [Candidatus Moranbacteria bacterium]
MNKAKLLKELSFLPCNTELDGCRIFVTDITIILFAENGASHEGLVYLIQDKIGENFLASYSGFHSILLKSGLFFVWVIDESKKDELQKSLQRKSNSSLIFDLEIHPIKNNRESATIH